MINYESTYCQCEWYLNHQGETLGALKCITSTVIDFNTCSLVTKKFVISFAHFRNTYYTVFQKHRMIKKVRPVTML